MIGGDGTIGEGQRAALTLTDHGLDGVAEKPACGRAIAQFARALEVFPGNLERFLKQLGKRNGHGWKTNQNRARSMSPAFRRTFVPFDCHRLGPKYHIPEYSRLDCFHHVGKGKMRIPPVAPKGIVHGHDLPGLVLRIRGNLPAGPVDVFNGSGRQAEQRARLANLDRLFRYDFWLFFRATVRLPSCRQPSGKPSERPWPSRGPVRARPARSLGRKDMVANSNKQRLRRYMVSRNESESSDFKLRAPMAHDSGSISSRIATGLSARGASARSLPAGSISRNRNL